MESNSDFENLFTIKLNILSFLKKANTMGGFYVSIKLLSLILNKVNYLKMMNKVVKKMKKEVYTYLKCVL